MCAWYERRAWLPLPFVERDYGRRFPLTPLGAGFKRARTRSLASAGARVTGSVQRMSSLWVRVPPMTSTAAHARITLRTVDPLGEKVRDPQCYGMALVTNHVRRSDFTSPTARRGAAAAVDGAARLPFAPSATDNDCASTTPSPSRLARSHHRPPRSFIGARSATTHLTRGNGSERP